MSKKPLIIPVMLIMILLSDTQPVLSDIEIIQTSPLGVIWGSDNGTINIVTYNTGIPTEMGVLPGVAIDASTTSTNPVTGGDGAHTIRLVTDVNAMIPGFGLIGNFVYNSSNPMTCTDTNKCGSTKIDFDKIHWDAKAGDTLNYVLQYNNSASQSFLSPTDFDSDPAIGIRHINYYRYYYTNDTLLPAGTYEGTVTISGNVFSASLP